MENAFRVPPWNEQACLLGSNYLKKMWRRHFTWWISFCSYHSKDLEVRVWENRKFRWGERRSCRVSAVRGVFHFLSNSPSLPKKPLQVCPLPSLGRTVKWDEKRVSPRQLTLCVLQLLNRRKGKWGALSSANREFYPAEHVVCERLSCFNVYLLSAWCMPGIV